jgi:hypothetical protein
MPKSTLVRWTVSRDYRVRVRVRVRVRASKDRDAEAGVKTLSLGNMSLVYVW